MSKKEKSFTGRLWPLAVTQSLGVFNDHAFKMISIFAVTNKSKEYSDDALFLSFLTVIYVMPFLIFPLISGFLADRFQKKKIMIAAKVCEFMIMLLGALALYKFDQWGMWPLIGVMFLMASQSAFFSPAFNGSLPEIFGEQEIAHANGTVGLFTFIAVISGVGGGTLLSGFFQSSLGLCGLILSFFSFMGLLAVLKAERGREGGTDVKWSWKVFSKYKDGYKLLVEKKSILFAILGESFFLTMGTAIQALSVLYAKHNLQMTDDLDVGLILLVPAFGIGFGSYFAGRLSGHKVEVGMVPFAGLFMGLFLALTVFAPGAPIQTGEHIIYPLVLSNLFLVGLFGGMFVIPLRSFYQQKTDEHSRGSLIANANVICFGMIMLSGLAMFFLTAGTGESQSGFLPGLTSYCHSISPSILFLWIAGLTVLLSLFLFLFMPVYALRFAFSIFIKLFYRVELEGVEKFPHKGPVLLIANHVSFIDGILLSLITDRLIRFMIHEEYYNKPLFKWFFKTMGYLPVSDPGSTKGLKSTIKTARIMLESGEVLGVFPEGKITRNGVMSRFHKGVNFMIPKNMTEDIPVIPIYMSNVWGSIFSYYFGGIKLRFPRELPYRIKIKVGDPIKGVDKNFSAYRLRQILAELASDAEMPPRKKEKTLHYQFICNAKRHPLKKVFFDSGKSPSKGGVSNFSVLTKALILSREIRKQSNSKFVGVLLPNTVNTSIVILAVLLADKVPAVLNYSVSDEILRKSIDKAGISLILTSKIFLKKAKVKKISEMLFLENLTENISLSNKFLSVLKALLLPSFLLALSSSEKSFRNMQSEAVLLFSSGSTGEPKGVLLSHHNITGDVNALVKVMGWDYSKDALLGNLPMFHSFGLTTLFWIPMMTGTRVVYIPNPLDASGAVQTVKDHKLSILLAIPSLLQSYMKKAEKEDFSSLRLLIVGAEKLRNDIAEAFYCKIGKMPMEGYGCTEAAPIIAINVPEETAKVSDSIGKAGSAGVPMPGICVKIVAQDDPSQELDVNESGLMLVKGPNIMLGYLKEPEKTKEVFRDGWYVTGDIAKVDEDGYIFITGRLSRFSKIGGEMVPHEMVESAINEIIKPDKRSIVVTGCPDAKKGEKLVVAYNIRNLKPAEIVAELRMTEQMPSLWIPKPDNFVYIDEIPTLGSGKVNFPALKKNVENIINP